MEKFQIRDASVKDFLIRTKKKTKNEMVHVWPIFFTPSDGKIRPTRNIKIRKQTLANVVVK